jgi:XTP/dITP diphosphohydrolase
MPHLLLATLNPGKRRELQDLLGSLGLDLLTPPLLGLNLTVDEVGDDYAVNAQRKALAFSQASGLWTLADDTGLEVDALEGAPGPMSARLAGAGRSDADRRQTLLHLLQDHPHPWTARFRCVTALASPSGQVDVAEGICSGEVIPEERGDEGFGYDPIFLVAGAGRTMAELTLEEKNRLSHRAHAIRALLPVLCARLGLNAHR